MRRRSFRCCDFFHDPRGKVPRKHNFLLLRVSKAPHHGHGSVNAIDRDKANDNHDHGTFQQRVQEIQFPAHARLRKAGCQVSMAGEGKTDKEVLDGEHEADGEDNGLDPQLEDLQNQGEKKDPVVFVF